MLNKSLKWMLFIAMALAAVAVQAKTVEIEGLDTLKFDTETITVKPGEEVTIKLVNNTDMPASAMSHNWVLLVADADAEAYDKAAAKAGADNDYMPSDMDDQVIAATGMVAGGESETITFTAPEEPGDYEYICTFPGHFVAGMKGVLKVEKS